MPKENTHLFFSSMLLEKSSHRNFSALLRNHSKAFFLGSVFPDAFFYHPEKKIESISNRLHGPKNRSRQNVDAFITAARYQNSPQDMAFILGYLSHLTLDEVFHPVIDRLSGDSQDPNPQKQVSATYRHRFLETALDRKVNTCCFMQDMIDLDRLSGLVSLQVLAEMEGVPVEEVKNAFTRQLTINKLFTKRWSYLWARLLLRFGKSDFHIILPLFYAHLHKEKQIFPSEFSIPGPANQNRGSITDLFTKTEELTGEKFDWAYQRYRDGSPSGGEV